MRKVREEAWTKLVAEKEAKARKEAEACAGQTRPTYLHSCGVTWMSATYDRFVCNGCRTRGEGLRYHCPEHKFDLHADCYRETQPSAEDYKKMKEEDERWIEAAGGGGPSGGSMFGSAGGGSYSV